MTRNLILTATTASFIFLYASAANADKTEDLKTAGDIVQIMLPVSAYGLTWLNGDKQGFMQFTKAFGGAVLTTQVSKRIIGRVRPDASNEQSYPSGHTTASFSGAEFIRMRYQNPWLSIPAYTGAMFVGYTRIRGNKHYRDDVLAGASIGMMWNWYATSPMAETVGLTPILMEDGFGIQFEYDFDGKKTETPVIADQPFLNFVFEFGSMKPSTNDVQAPRGTGSKIDFAAAQEDASFTSRVFIEYFMDRARRHELEIYLAPIEIIDYTNTAELTDNVEFAGATFTNIPGSNVSARFRYGEYRANYLYRLIQNNRWDIRLGGGIQYFDTKIAIKQFTGSAKDPDIIHAQGEVNEGGLSGVASGRAIYRFTPRWNLELQADIRPLDDDWYTNAAAHIGYRVSPQWEVTLGGRWIYSDYETSKLDSKFEQFSLVMQVSHSFF